VLLCINGTGILNSWLKNNFFAGSSYPQMNEEAASISAGSEGLKLYPFGNGAERVLQNKEPGAQLKGLHFNRHNRAHVARAAQEGIVFSLQYGMETMRAMGMELSTVRAGLANMFLSPVFASAFATVTGCTLQLYNTDGSAGAARAAGLGAGIYKSDQECFQGMQVLKQVNPDAASSSIYKEAYESWKAELEF
jgi:xylulokinase